MDEVETSAVCRLCLEITSGGNIQPLEGFTMYMLKLIAPVLNLEISSEPKVCKTCSEKVKISYDFKLACMENNEISQPAFLNMKKKQKEETCKCCLCDSKANLKTCKAREILVLNTMLDKCLPELDIKKTSAICPDCLKSLVNLFAFFNLCNNTEDKIKKYMQVKGVNRKGQVSLLDIFHVHYIVKVEEAVEQEEDSVEQEEDQVTIDHEENQVTIDPEDAMSVCDDLEEEVAIALEEGGSDGGLQDFEQHDIKIDICDNGLQPEGTVQGTDSDERKCKIYDEKTVMEKYKCMLCEFFTCRKGNLTQHMRRRHKDVPRRQIYKCKQCSFRSAEKMDVILHLKQKHHIGTNKGAYPLQYKCLNCGYKTKYKSYMARHVKTHQVYTSTDLNESEPNIISSASIPKSQFYNCEKCNYSTLKIGYLWRHKCQPEMKCPDCGYKTKERKKFCEHLMGHEISQKKTIKMYHCSVCDYESKNRHHVMNHELTHKDPSEVQMFRCPSCKHQTKRKYDLNSHLIRVHKMSKGEVKKEMERIVNLVEN